MHTPMTLARLVCGTLLALLVSTSASAQDPPQQLLELVAFSDNGKLYALKVTDQDRALMMFEVRDAKKNEVVARFPFEEDTEKKAWRKAKREHELTAEPSESAENTKKNVTLMTSQKDDKLNVFVMRGDAIKMYDEIQLLTAKDAKKKKKKKKKKKDKDGATVEANVLKMAWGPKFKHAVIIYHQKFTDMFEFEGDFVYSFKYKSFKVKFE